MVPVPPHMQPYIWGPRELVKLSLERMRVMHLAASVIGSRAGSQRLHPRAAPPACAPPPDRMAPACTSAGGRGRQTVLAGVEGYRGAGTFPSSKEWVHHPD